MVKKLFIFDVGGTLRDDSYACYEGYRLGFERARVTSRFTLEEVWRLRGIGKYNRSTNCIKALLAFAKSKKRIGGALASDDPERYIDGILDEVLDDQDELLAKTILAARGDFMDSDQAIGTMKLYPMVNEALENLVEAGHALAVLSNISDLDALKKSLGDLDVSVFSAMLSAGQVKEKKPSGAGILAVSEDLGFDMGNVYYVGDTQVDVSASRNAGCRAISVLTGMGTRRILELSRPDLIFDDVYSMSIFFQK